ncbi:MAG: CobW family GTP-binding protein [Oscillospiraceae bacterium]
MTKIDIYSGFLGAGKTTLIKKMIKEAYAGEKLVLIENEFGEIGIDGGFLQEAGIQITEMNSGCICCSLVGDFGRALEKVIADYAPDRILIEPSGVGKLSDVIAAVQKVTREGVELGNFVTVADATKCKMYMKNFGEFYNNQIETANTIVLSRTGGMNEAKLDQCVAMIREHNAAATLVTTPWEQLTGEQLMQAMEQRTSIADELAAMEKEAHEHHHHHDEDGACDDPNCCCHHHHDDDEDEHEHHHHHHHHDEDGACDDPDCCCHHHHDDDDEDEHEHHHHHHHHDEDGGCDDPDCCCHHHHDEGEDEHEHHHHHHHGHDADEVFVSWGEQTHKKFTEAQIADILGKLADEQTYGIVLRAKGYVANSEAERWIHFDYVPGESDIRDGCAMVTGRVCVIGSKLNEPAIAALFGVEH